MKYFKVFKDGIYLARGVAEDTPDLPGYTYAEITRDEMAPPQLGWGVDSNGDFTVPPPPPDISQITVAAKNQLLANLNTFYEKEPDGSVRYDSNFRELAILFAVQNGMTASPIPALFAWRSALYAEYTRLKAQIDTIAGGSGTDDEKALAIQAVDISIATFESKFGKNGSVRPDPCVLTEQLMG